MPLRGFCCDATELQTKELVISTSRRPVSSPTAKYLLITLAPPLSSSFSSLLSTSFKKRLSFGYLLSSKEVLAATIALLHLARHLFACCSFDCAGYNENMSLELEASPTSAVRPLAAFLQPHGQPSACHG